MKGNSISSYANQPAPKFFDVTTSTEKQDNNGYEDQPNHIAWHDSAALVFGLIRWKGRAANISTEQPSEIAEKAATARWKQNGCE